MSTELYQLITQSQEGTEPSTLAVLKRFEPLIKKYAYKLIYEDALQDLTLTFLEATAHFTLDTTFSNDGQVVNYFTRVIYHEYIKLSKKSQRREMMEMAFDEALENETMLLQQNFEDNAVKEMLSDLTAYQKSVIFLHYFEGYSIHEIAEVYGVSRQAINKVKNTALKELRKHQS